MGDHTACLSSEPCRGDPPPDHHTVDVAGSETHTINLAEIIDVYNYSTFDWVARLYGEGSHVAWDELYAAGTSNRPPSLDEIGAVSCEEGVLCEVHLSGVDPDDDAITYSAHDMPEGATLDSVTGQFSWTPTEAGRYEVVFQVQDNADEQVYDSEIVTIEVTARAQCELKGYDIYSVGIDTGRSRRITTLANTAEFNPDWSPSGRFIVHDVVEYSADCSTSGQSLYVTDVRTRESRPLEGGEGGNDATWSPHGAFIAFDKAADERSEQGIYVAAVAGGTPRLVLNDARNPAWSPDARFLVFERPSDGTMHAIDLVTGRQSLVVAGGSKPT